MSQILRIQWIGIVYDHLYCIYMDGRTFRLDRFVDVSTNYVTREWIEVARLPE